MPKITPYKPSQAEADALTMVYDRFEKMKRKRTDFEDDWNQADKQYQMWRPRRHKDDWRANLKLPMTFSVIETAISEMVDQSPGINLLPRKVGQAVNAESLEKIWKYTWEKGNGDIELIKFMKDALLYGTGIGEEYYRQDVVMKKELEDFDLELFRPTKWRKREETGFDDCYFESIPIWDFFIDPMATSLETANDCIKRVRMSFDDFKFRYKKYPNAKKAAGGGPADSPARWFDPTKSWGEDEVAVIHYYNKQKDLYLVIANDVMLTPHDNPNPYRHKDFPFVRAVDVLLPHSFYGLGEPKIMECLEDELNTIRNMRLDTAHLNIHTMFLVDDKLELDDADLVARPHGAIKGPVDSIKPVADKPLKQEAYKEEELLKDDIIRATGIDPRLQALGGKGNTATEISILKESSLKRIRLKLRLMERLALYRLARLRIANIQQFYAIPQIKQIVGEAGLLESAEFFRSYGAYNDKGQYRVETAKPEQLTGEFDIIVVPGSTLPISKSLEAQKTINLFDRLNGHPDVDQRKLVEDLIRANDKNPAEIMVKPGEAPLGESLTAQTGVPPQQNGTRPGFNQNTLKAQDVMPQKIFGNTPNLNT